MTDQDPHPLVAALAHALLPKDDAGQIAALLEGAAQERAANAEQVLANALAADSNQPELMAFGGYLGGVLNDKAGSTKATWRLLYLDAKLFTWLLVKNDEIVLRFSLKDPKAAFEARDVIWLRSTASVSQGSGPPKPGEVQSRFLRGEFTSAGDFATTLAGGTFSPATGLLCEVNTPGCCGKRTR